MATIVKGEKRGRPGKYLVDYRDSARVRRWATFNTYREAQDFMARVIPESRQQTRPAVDPNITVADYSARWLEFVAATTKARTQEVYRSVVETHILPALGPRKVRTLRLGDLSDFLLGKLRKPGTANGLARATVKMLLAVLRAMLERAKRDGIVLANPCDGLGRDLKLGQAKQARQDAVDSKAFDRDELALFLQTAEQSDDGYLRRLYPFFLFLARTGARLGEALGLQWGDLNFMKGSIHLARQISRGRHESLKSGHSRTVDMSVQLAECLHRLDRERKAETLRHGWPTVPEWVFVTSKGTSYDPGRVWKAMRRVCTKAGLPLRSPHALRHTYASVLISEGASPAYVQAQLGHASISLTVDTYGNHLPRGNRATVNTLDDQQPRQGQRGSGSKTVASAV